MVRLMFVWTHLLHIQATCIISNHGSHRWVGVCDLVRPLFLDGVGVEVFGRPRAYQRERAVVGALQMQNNRLQVWLWIVSQ